MGTVPGIFNHKKFGKIRVVVIDDEPYFVGKDVAMALGYKDHINALKSHVELEDKRGWQITTPFGEQEMTIINESGLYSLILTSTLPSAKQFKHWITSEVLPSIRKYGYYENGATPNDSDNAEIDYKKVDYLIKLAKTSPSDEQKIKLIDYAAQIIVPTFKMGTMGTMGTNGKGKEYKSRKLTPEQLKEIREKYSSGEIRSILKLAKIYGVAKSTIQRIITR